jgi:L-idonate 5-dehydrogenase
MKALVLHGAGDLRFEEYPCEPVGPGEVLVRMAAGGICGSDLHYFNHGGFGEIRVRQPIVLGHEVSGYIEAIGDRVEGLRVGQLVAVSPSQPCGACSYCRAGMLNHCENMLFLGSAMRFPHVQGAFRERMVTPAGQCVPADGLSPAEAAVAEPLAVCRHAASLAGDMEGRTVLVTGCGPIGVLMVMVARQRGAARVIATDIADFPLETAGRAGAHDTVNVSERTLPEAGAVDKRSVDVLFECSGVPGVTASAVPLLKPRGTVVQVGFGGSVELPMAAMTAKEITLRGSFRFTTEFADAVETLRAGEVDANLVITHRYEPHKADTAFAVAADRHSAVKVQLDFSTD